jgi:hypothetical protein
MPPCCKLPQRESRFADRCGAAACTRLAGNALRAERSKPRQRSSEPTSGRAQIGLVFLLPSDPSLATTTARLCGCSASHVTSGRILNRRVEIPMERGSVAPHIPRVPSLNAFG